MPTIDPVPALLTLGDRSPVSALVVEINPPGCRWCPFRSRARRLDLCNLGGGDGMTERGQVHLGGVPEDRPLSCPLHRVAAVVR